MTNDDAIEILKNIQDNIEETLFLDRCAIDMAIEALKNQRKHGEWKVVGRETFSPNVTYRCSVCKTKEVSCIPNDKPHYCENCGADMRPKEGEAE